VHIQGLTAGRSLASQHTSAAGLTVAEALRRLSEFEPNRMRRPPRTRSERLLSWKLTARAYLFLGVLEAAAAMVCSSSFSTPPAGNTAIPWRELRRSTCRPPPPAWRRVIMQVMNVFLCRHPQRSALLFGLFSNPLILLGVAAEIGLLVFIVYTPARQLAVRHRAGGDGGWVVRGGVGDVDGDIGGSAQGVAAASNGGRPVPEFLELRFSLTGVSFLVPRFSGARCDLRVKPATIRGLSPTW
jgi:hypothetical protein